MNILHLARTMGQGGAEKIIYQLVSGCQSADCKSSVASCGGVYVESLKKKGISHYEIPDLECKKPQVILRTLRILIHVIRKENIQVIHSHHRMAALYGRILKCFFPYLKLVYTAHNVFFDKVRLTAMVLKNTEIVAVGESVKNNLIEVFGVEEECIATIFNAVDISNSDIKADARLEAEQTDALSEAVPAQVGSINKSVTMRMLREYKQNGYTLIGIIGRMSKQKGIDVFIKAMALLGKKYPNIKGILVGDGELRKDLEAMAKSLGLEEMLCFLGYQEDVMAVIAQMDFAAMPSRWEGFPLTPIELFAMGKTLAATDIGGINEIVEDGRNGLLVQKEDEKELAMALEVLLMNEELRRQLAEQARLDYEDRYSYDSFLNNYIELYQTLALS